MTYDAEAILESLGPGRKFADPSSPAQVRSMAATGALPLPPVQIATVLFLLARDPDEAIRERATQSLAALPERIVEPALSGKLPGALLDHFARIHPETSAWLQKIALNPATPDETFCYLATLPDASLIDIVAANQTRLLRCPTLVDALSENPVTSQATLDRILEFLGIRVAESAEPAPSTPEVPEPDEGTASEAVEPVDVASSEDIPKTLIEDPPETTDNDEQRKRSASVFALVQDMGVMQKIKLARFGNAEARAILVRDRNKLVSSAVMNSPKLSETEVVAFAKSRAVSEETLRAIGTSREWTKSRSVKHALATNPKTPLGIAMQYLNYLSDLELKQIMRSKDVASQIATQAKRILIKKGKA